MNKTNNAKKIQTLAGTALVTILIYVLISWWVFQWRNPLANQASFYRDSPSVMKWEKLSKYQSEWQWHD